MSAPTRRGLLDSVAVLSAHRAKAQAAPSSNLSAAPAAGPDADLLAACAEFDQLEWVYITTFPDDRDLTEAEEEAVRPERDLIQQAQHYLANRMVELRATTQAGQVARARSLALWEGGDPTADVNGRFLNIRLLGAILRDLTKGSAGA